MITSLLRVAVLELKTLFAPLESQFNSIMSVIPPEIANVFNSGAPMEILGFSIPSFFVYLFFFTE